VSHTTRKKRETEVNGKDYWFVDDETFQRMVDNGAFLEHTINHEKHYGTSYEAIESLLA